MILSMLRRASLDIDVNRINMAGMTALHQVSDGAVLVSLFDDLMLSWFHGDLMSSSHGFFESCCHGFTVSRFFGMMVSSRQC